MSSRKRIVAVVTTALVLSAVAGLALDDGDGAPQFLRGEERATITEAVADHEPFARGRTVRMAVAVEMEDGMHVNANPPSFDWLIPVVASIEGVEGVSLVEAFYPEPVSRQFPYDDEPYLVYEDEFVIGLLIEVVADISPGGRELEIVVNYQACNDEACFAPTDATVKYPIMIVADPADSKEVTSRLLNRAPFPR